MTSTHCHELRVYYEDTDFSGFVYHANYLKFLERGRTELLRSLGIVNSQMHREEDGLAFVVIHMTLDFLKPAVMDDWLRIETVVPKATGVRMMMEQSVWRGTDCLLRAKVGVASVRNGRPARLPALLRGQTEKPDAGETP